MKLRDLEYLVAVADQRNFHRAAEICGVSQPTLSAQIRKLEDELGLPLFERSPRKVALTRAGSLLLARARRVLDEVAQIRAEADNLRETGTPSLHLGVFPTLGPYLLPRVIPRFLKQFPGVELMLTEEKSSSLTRKLVDGHLDAALLALPVMDSHLTGRVLFDEPFRLAVPDNHPLARENPPIGPDMLAGQHLMLLEKGHCLRDQALELCRNAGAREYDDFRATSLETLRQMVIAGVGMTLLPALACRQTEGMAVLPVASDQFRRRIGLFWRKSTSHEKLMNGLADLLGQIAGDLLNDPSASPAG
ncbi:LysR substrate-binding domain-containing protein [Paracoccus aestuariivivens]|uniref:LysR family transcriptional regulator n=1 Tax=Paracoccus aestuariivivens TaxID=1820333 RepID=A0A6L6JDF2_9RHOB|nr:LysR substrate-binding domain-containing protein [Paracoccus aestuariivivens]MTH77941.1 LysR family transcriptional regulator [Paracoccus aestuariivivens]